MTTPDTTTITTPTPSPRDPRWRRLVPRRRPARIAAVTIAALLLAGAGFGAGYAVGHDGGDTQPPPGFSRDGGRPDWPMDGGNGGPPSDQQGAPSQQTPDYDGDGQPDTTGSGTGTEDSSQAS